jgi:hypothetical protein
MDNTICTKSGPNIGLVYFYVKSFYQQTERYPDSVIGALSQIGGLLAIFKIGIFLAYFHQRRYEKKLLNSLEGSKGDEKIDIKELK